jgi:isoquinoline 1-oxidoreductase beta subunit
MKHLLDQPITRRLVLTGSAAGLASLLVPVTIVTSHAQSPDHQASQAITDWIAIAPTGEVTLGLSQPEVGQGSYTVLPQILADELDANWLRVIVRFVTGKEAYKIAFKNEVPAQKEGASMSTTAFYERLRTAGATAREALTRAAAMKWRVPSRNAARTRAS